MSTSGSGIQKLVIHAGKGEKSSFKDGTKILFHYQTRKCDADRTILDDSRKHVDTQPMQLVTGKKFKLEIWEACLTTMLKGEVASFTVDPMHCTAYPMVAKSLRDIRNKKQNVDQHVHHCGMALKEQGLGYCDLDQLMKEPQKLEFILEVVEIHEEGEYQKDTWAMSVEEKLDEVPALKEKGNALFKEKKYSEAADTYGKAIGLLDQLLLREKPGDSVYVELDMKKVPFLLNYSQCKLFLGDYYAVIEHTTEVLKKDPDNVKAHYRRAKAHVGAWNPEEAKQDFLRAAQLDPSLSVTKELKDIELKIKEKEKQDRAMLQGKLFS